MPYSEKFPRTDLNWCHFTMAGASAAVVGITHWPAGPLSCQCGDTFREQETAYRHARIFAPGWLAVGFELTGPETGESTTHIPGHHFAWTPEDDLYGLLLSCTCGWALRVESYESAASEGRAHIRGILRGILQVDAPEPAPGRCAHCGHGRDEHAEFTIDGKARHVCPDFADGAALLVVLVPQDFDWDSLDNSDQHFADAVECAHEDLNRFYVYDEKDDETVASEIGPGWECWCGASDCTSVRNEDGHLCSCGENFDAEGRCFGCEYNELDDGTFVPIEICEECGYLVTDPDHIGHV